MSGARRVTADPTLIRATLASLHPVRGEMLQRLQCDPIIHSWQSHFAIVYLRLGDGGIGCFAQF